MMRLPRPVPFMWILLVLQKITADQIPQRYHLINEYLNWNEAQNYCRVKYSDLAVVNSMVDQNKLVDVLGHQLTSSWIGLQRGSIRRWIWSDGRGEPHFTMWASGQPSGDEWCTELSATGSWNDMSCGNERAYVCYKLQPNGDKSYMYYSDKHNWLNSLELCRTKHTDMAYISNQEENKYVSDLVKTWTSAIWLHSKVWIGLSNDAWVWSDGSQSSFRYWSRPHAAGNCATVSQQGGWVGANCNNKATFVCQGGPKVKKMIIRMVISSDVNINTRTARHELLTKLETELKHKSVTDFKLIWQRDSRGIIFKRQQQSEAKKTGC